MWDTNTACIKFVEYVCKKRDKQPRCVVCDIVLFNYEDHIYNLLSDWEFKKRRITREMIPNIMKYFYNSYPYLSDERFCGHHTNYEKDIKVPVCPSCHGKIHGRSEFKYAKWKPVDKRPLKEYEKRKKTPEVVV